MSQIDSVEFDMRCAPELRESLREDGGQSAEQIAFEIRSSIDEYLTIADLTGVRYKVTVRIDEIDEGEL